MRLRNSLILGAISLALAASTASAQVQTGAIQGTVTDETTGVPMLLVTVVASSSALQGTQSEFTDDSGQFFMSALPAGSYSLLFIYGDAKVKRSNVEVGVGKTTVVNAKINTAATGEVITIKEKAPAIDAGSTKQGTTLQQDYMKNVPNRGRSWQGVLGAAAGSQGDQYGTSFSGSTSVENSYVVDGVNTSGVTLGANFPTQGSNVLNNFIQEIEVITGGYNAEFGRSTGGVVNVVTKTGSNEFHGSVFANVLALNAGVERIPRAVTMRMDFKEPTIVDFGFELGGPIIKDRLWFYVGFAPTIQRTTVNRVVGSAVDRRTSGIDYGAAGCPTNTVDGTCDGDGDPSTTSAVGCELDGNCESDEVNDVDDNGLDIFEQVESRELSESRNSYQFTAKLNMAVAPEHQGQLGIVGTPQVGSNLISGFPGTPTATQRNETSLNTDVALKWTSKFFDNKTQLDATVGWHRYKRDFHSINEFLPNDPTRRSADTSRITITDPAGDVATNSWTLGGVGNNNDVPETPAVMARCTDSTDRNVDLFPSIRNCPVGVDGYRLNSLGVDLDLLEQRWAGKLTATQRVKALGHHQFKAGIDVENNTMSNPRDYNGGAVLQNTRNRWQFRRFVIIDDEGTDFCTNISLGGGDERCTYVTTKNVNGETLNIGAFVQDSWSLLPNLTINAGLRYEQQYLRYSDSVAGTIDPVTMREIGKNAMELTDLFAPRVGLVFDWTKEGRSKIYANWGRFYESIPMDINDRAFGGETTYFERWNHTTGNRCGAPNPGIPAFPNLPTQCPKSRFDNIDMPGVRGPNGIYPSQAFMLGASNPAYGIAPGTTLVLPDTSAQYLDEFVFGVEYEILEDLRLGVSYQNRRLGRVIEDVSTDGGNTYFIANPGEFNDDAEAALISQINALDRSDPMQEETRTILKTRLRDFQQTRRFDTPQRVYNAVQLTASKRFSRDFMVQGSYTYSVLEGNYPGLFSPDTGQLDPNITSMYDLFELLANRNGKLPFDRPHAFKLDGYYKFDLKEAGRVTAGTRLRAQSGTPVTPLGYHAAYQNEESFLIPRGTGGRTDFETNVDLHVAYGRKIGNMDLEVYFELFNVLNNQGETAVDTEYTQTPTDPIVGGTMDDLYYLKTSDISAIASGRGDGTVVPVDKLLNYANTEAKQSPLAARIGVTLSF